MRCALALIGFLLWTVSAFAALGTEGISTTTSSSGTFSTNVTTTGTNELAVLYISYNQTSATGNVPRTAAFSGSGNTFTWTQRGTEIVYHNTGANNDWAYVQVWTAPIASAVSFTLTTTLSGTYDNAVAASFAITGGPKVSGSPWDTNVGLPATTSATGASTAPTITGVSTTCDKTMLLTVTATSTTGAITAQTVGTIGGTTANLIADLNQQGGTDRVHMAVQQLVVAATQSSITEAWPTSWNGWVIAADAVQDSTASCGGAATPQANPMMMLGVGP